MKPTVKITKFKFSLVGITVPSKANGEAGRYIEQLLVERGIAMQNGRGVDCEFFGLEVKSRDIDSVSAQTVACMTPQDIVNTDYIDSAVFKKFQLQYRVKTKDRVIVEDQIFDFSPDYIQSLIKDAYETARANLTAELTKYGVSPNYIPGTYWGYLERTQPGKSESYEFRIGLYAFDKLESMTKTTLKNPIFDWSNQ